VSGGSGVAASAPVSHDQPRDLRGRIGRWLHALGRRGEGRDVVSFDGLVLNRMTREVTRSGRSIHLTPIEFDLLDLLLTNPRRVLHRSEILLRVWGFDFGQMSNSLNVYIGYLRRKTEAAGESRLIHTVRGVGYVLRTEQHS
jgi:two-component system, OmpR family, response regulator MprA